MQLVANHEELPGPAVPNDLLQELWARILLGLSNECSLVNRSSSSSSSSITNTSSRLVVDVRYSALVIICNMCP